MLINLSSEIILAWSADRSRRCEWSNLVNALCVDDLLLQGITYILLNVYVYVLLLLIGEFVHVFLLKFAQCVFVDLP